MNNTEVKLQYDICEINSDAIPVIVVAAGSSTRMQGLNKQFMPILGVPVIARTLMAFENCLDISKIIIVAASDHILDMQLICEKYAFVKVCDIVVGGNNRHQSVMNGINRLDTSDTKILIHDGARPFIENVTISEVANALKNFDAALCVSKINDTVKSIDDNGIVQSTVDRSTLYAAQTPQGVDVKKYIVACNTLSEVESYTDDASIMEAAGYTVKAVIGNGKNIKITTPDDIAIAEALVKGDCAL